MASISMATNSFPWSHALAPSGSIFRKCPRPSNDLRRLNASSICQRARYVSNTVSPEQVLGSVVNTNMYSADSSVSGFMICPYFLLSRVALSFAIRADSLFFFMAQILPLMFFPSRQMTTTSQSPIFEPLSVLR